MIDEAGIPAGWQVTTFGQTTQVQVAAPAEWEQPAPVHDEKLSGTAYRLQTSQNRFGSRSGVSVSIIGAPLRNARQTVAGMRARVRFTQYADDIEAAEIEWSGAVSAWSLRYAAKVLIGGSIVPHRVDIVVLDLLGGEQVHVTAVALAEEFETLRLPDIVASATIAR